MSEPAQSRAGRALEKAEMVIVGGLVLGAAFSVAYSAARWMIG